MERASEAAVKGFVELVGPESHSDVGRLRRQAYNRNLGMQVADESVFWNRSDDQSYVLAARNETGVVATMRLECLQSAELFMIKLEISELPDGLDLPSAVLSRAATRKDHLGSGFNALLRYHCVRLARDLGMRHIAGTFLDNSPRQRSMARMGYRLLEHPHGWNSADFQSQGGAVLALLDLQESAEQCLSACAIIAGDLMNAYPWRREGKPPQKFVEVIK